MQMVMTFLVQFRHPNAAFSRRCPNETLRLETESQKGSSQLEELVELNR